jgi:hypothetical protein
MAFVHPDDLENLQRLLGVTEPPPDIMAEYEMRILMSHSLGGYGPLGSLGLVDLLRYLGVKPRRIEAAQAGTNWEKIPLDTPVLAGPYMGEMKLGKFKGGCYMGTLQVELIEDGSPVVREVRAGMVQLAPVDFVPEPEPVSDNVSPHEPEPKGPFIMAVVEGNPIDCVLVEDRGDQIVVQAGGKEYTIPRTDAAI